MILVFCRKSIGICHSCSCHLHRFRPLCRLIHSVITMRMKRDLLTFFFLSFPWLTSILVEANNVQVEWRGRRRKNKYLKHTNTRLSVEMVLGLQPKRFHLYPVVERTREGVNRARGFNESRPIELHLGEGDLLPLWPFSVSVSSICSQRTHKKETHEAIWKDLNRKKRRWNSSVTEPVPFVVVIETEPNVDWLERVDHALSGEHGFDSGDSGRIGGSSSGG